MVSCCCFGAFLKLVQILIAISNLIALTARGKLCNKDDHSNCVEYYNVRNFVCLQNWVAWKCHETLGLLLPICATITTLICIALNCATAKKRAKRFDASLAVLNVIQWTCVIFLYNYYCHVWWPDQSALKTYSYPLNWYFAMVSSVLLVGVYFLEIIIVVASPNFYYDVCCRKVTTFLDTSEDASMVDKDEETNLMQVTLAVPNLHPPKRSTSCHT